MKTPEGYEKAEIKKYLTSIGAFHFSPTMAGYGRSGVPDIVACIGGRFWGIEVKREGKKPTPRQWKMMAEINEAGGASLCGTAAVVIRGLQNIDYDGGYEQSM